MLTKVSAVVTKISDELDTLEKEKHGRFEK